MLREAIRRGDFLGKRVESHLAKGELVPDGLIFELLELNLKSPGTARLLFDGFPRTMGQVPLLERFEEPGSASGSSAISTSSVSREAAVLRMTGRRVCPDLRGDLSPDRQTAQGPRRPATSTAPGSNDGPTTRPRSSNSASRSTTSTPCRSSSITPSSRCPDLCRTVNGEQPFDAVYAEARRAIVLESSPAEPSPPITTLSRARRLVAEVATVVFQPRHEEASGRESAAEGGDGDRAGRRVGGDQGQEQESRR